MMARVRPRIALAAALFATAVCAVLIHVAAFDRSLRDHVVPLAPATFATPPGGPWVAPVGRFSLPAPGILRVVVCPSRGGDPHATLEVDDAQSTRSLFRHAFSADESRGGRCQDAAYHADQPGDVVARVRFDHANRPPVVTQIETSASLRITPWSIWPVLVLLASFVLMITAPHRTRPVAPTGAALDSSDLTIDPQTGAVRVAEPHVDEVPVRRPIVDWRFSWMLALAAYLGALFATGVVGAGFMVLSGRRNLLDSGVFTVVTLLVQHGLMALVSLLFLGVFDARDGRRRAAGLIPLTRRQLLEGIVAGLGLCLVAAASTRLIHDVSASPMGRAIEHMPIRYAIGFGALLAPLTEELYFRGVLVRAFGKRSAVVGVVASALIFTAAHALQLMGAWAGLIPICAVAVTNGWLRVRSGGITQPWLVHTVYNLTLSAGLYLGDAFS